MVKYTPGRRAQLPRPEPPQPRKVLRAGREPAALQAALHGRRLRPVLPDRALLPRRGPPARPSAGVHPDRRRDELRHPGRRLRGDRGARLHASGRRLLGVELSRAPSRACPSRSRWPATATTSPTCASSWPHTDLTGLVKAEDGGGVPMLKERGRPPAAIVKAPARARLHGLLPRRARQARGVREGHGREGARPRQGGRGRRVDPVAAREDHHPGAAPGDERRLRGRARRPPPLPVRAGEHRAHRAGKPARAPCQEAGAHPRARLAAAPGTSSGSWTPRSSSTTRSRRPGPPRTTPSPGRTTRTCNTSRATRGR